MGVEEHRLVHGGGGFLLRGGRGRRAHVMLHRVLRLRDAGQGQARADTTEQRLQHRATTDARRRLGIVALSCRADL